MDAGQQPMSVFYKPLVGATVVESIAFVMVPMSYFFVFAATSGLISDIKDAYGDMYSVFLYASYYLPGLPLALLQQRFDVENDLVHSSFVTFQVRMIACFAVLFASAVTLSQDRESSTLMTVTAFVGIATWAAHGTCTQLVQLRAQGHHQVQLGAGLSNVFALVLVLATEATSYGLHENAIDYYYYVAAVVVSVGCLAWLYLLQCSDEFSARLDIRDARLLSTQSEETAEAEGEAASALLDNNTAYSHPRRVLAADAENAGLESMPYESRERHKTGIRRLVAAMFINVFASNLMGNLFVYVPTDEVGKIATVLVFSRLLALAATKMTSSCRPSYCHEPKHFLLDASLRAATMVLFFLYLGEFFKADWFIILYVLVISFLAGINLTFAHVASQEICLTLPQEYQENAFASTAFQMNVAFNAGGFTAAIVSMVAALVIRYH